MRPSTEDATLLAVGLRVLIADRHRLMIAGIRRALSGATDIEVVGTTTSGARVLPLVARTSPDIALVGLRLPELDGLGCIDALHVRHPEVKTVILSSGDDPRIVEATFRHGGAGLIVKRIDPAALPRVLREIAAGDGFSFPPTAASGTLSALTPREREMLMALAAGRSNKQIARELWLTEQTVKYHLTNLYRKLGVTGRTAALNYAYEHGLIENPLLLSA
jgi:DNA-binding NarL/FixJ family response regulator